MSPQALLNCTTYVNGVDITAGANMWKCKETGTKKDFTNFAGGGKTQTLISTKTVDGEYAGFCDYSLNEPTLRALFGVVDSMWMFSPNGAANENGCLFYRALEPDLSVGDKVGEVAPISVGLTGSTSEGEMDGFLILPKTTFSNAATTNGTAYQNGACAATQSVFAMLHVFSVAGSATPTIASKLQSSADGSSSWTDRITLSNATALGAQLGSYVGTSGAITDTYWRTVITLTGTSPVIAAAIGMAIQTT